MDQSSFKHKRRIQRVLVTFDSGDTFDENRQKALDFKKDIESQCWKWVSETFTKTENNQGPRRLLAVINPFSGRKKGLEIYRERILPLLQLAGVIIVEELVTERKNHAKEFIKTFDLSLVTGIIAVGGDGTLYEIINGLASRDDHENALKTPVGLLPTGSGNGLVGSILHEVGDNYTLENAIFQVIRGGLQAIDLATVTTRDNQSLLVFLSVAWGIIADLDIESEKFRFLGGEIRTTLGGLGCILRKRTYRGRVSYLPITNKEHSSPVSALDEQNDRTTTQQNNGNDAPLEEEATNLCTPLTTANNDNPELSGPLPSDWITVDGYFVGILLGLTPKLASNSFGNPNSSVGDGEMYLLLLTDELSRSDLLHMLMTTETGEFVNHDKVTIVRVRACRIEPLTTQGRLVADGEEIEYGPIQVHLNKTISTFSRKLLK